MRRSFLFPNIGSFLQNDHIFMDLSIKNSTPTIIFYEKFSYFFEIFQFGKSTKYCGMEVSESSERGAITAAWQLMLANAICYVLQKRLQRFIENIPV